MHAEPDRERPTRLPWSVTQSSSPPIIMRLNFATDPTLAAIDAALEAESASEQPRPYFGASSAGDDCVRKLWYRFRWAKRETFDAATLKRFADGHAGETMQADRLRKVQGVKLQTIDPKTGEQWAVMDCGGHLRGHLDGVIVGLLQAPKTPHVWEHKQVGEKGFDGLRSAVQKHGEKDALAHWNATYFAQAQIYMHLRKLARHYLTVSTPGGRDTTSVRTEHQADKAKSIIKRAADIIFAASPPEGVSADPAWWQCKMCSFHSLCHGNAAPAVSCRSCAHATPEREGAWACGRNPGDAIPVEFQRVGCVEHRYIPQMVARLVDLESHDEVTNDTVWRSKINNKAIHQPKYSSSEFCVPGLLGDDGVESFKAMFGHGTMIKAPLTPKESGPPDTFSDLPWLSQKGVAA